MGKQLRNKAEVQMGQGLVEDSEHETKKILIFCCCCCFLIFFSPSGNRWLYQSFVVVDEQRGSDWGKGRGEIQQPRERKGRRGLDDRDGWQSSGPVDIYQGRRGPGEHPEKLLH